jgi:uncharacterized membrane protein
MKRSSLTVTLSMLAVFLSGALVGAFGHRLYTVRSVSADLVRPAKPTPEDWRRREIDELRTRLKLDETQVSRLDTILDQTRDRFHAMRERSRPEAEQIRQDQRNHIRAMLNASQLPEYEKIVQEKDQKRNAPRKP